MTTQKKPINLFKLVDIPNLIEIQTELKTCFENNYYDHVFNTESGTAVHKKNYLYPGILETIWKECPSWIKFLEDMKLLDRWATAYFSTVVDGSKVRPIAHVDDPHRFFALQIPVINCEGSYTVFYDADPKDAIKALIPYYPDSIGYTNDKLNGEIGILPSHKPAFIDISVPHRPVVPYDEPRVLLTARFKPELWDYLENF